ncbi:MAG: capsule assembly Wzi family protein [Rhodothermales bacterium]|nr:capsule assembly Wzi family protein [Rhodothermales bacterium]
MAQLLQRPPSTLTAAIRLGWLAGVLLWVALPARAQSWTYEAGISATAATERTLPFWLATNRYGTVDPTSANALASGRVGYARRLSDRVDYTVGARVLARASDNAAFYLHELFGHVRYADLLLSAGLFEDQYGMVDTRLSLGSMIWSRNTTPMPKIVVQTKGFITVPRTREFLAVRARFGHGWFPRSAFVDRALLHEKYLYLRLFSEESPVRLFGGVIHNVVWGGVHPVEGDLATGAIDFVRVVMARAGDDLQFEADNSLGNTVAAYDTRAEIDLDRVDIAVYRQFYIETGSSLLFRNAIDGLWGLRLDFKQPIGPFDAVLWEHANTKKQSQRAGTTDTRGRDTYYNNALYRDGWTYRGRTIGLPLLRTDGVRPGVINNILVAHHVGVSGHLSPSFPVLLMATYSRNYGAGNICADAACLNGTSEITDRRDQLALLVQLSARPLREKNLYVDAAVAADVGPFAPESFGLSMGVRWTGVLNHSRPASRL